MDQLPTKFPLDQRITLVCRCFFSVFLRQSFCARIYTLVDGSAVSGGCEVGKPELSATFNPLKRCFPTSGLWITNISFHA